MPGCIIFPDPGLYIFYQFIRELQSFFQFDKKYKFYISVYWSAYNDGIRQLAEEMMQRCPALVGVVENINRRRDNVLLGQETKLIVGRDHLFEELNGIRFRLNAPSFFQVNPHQAQELYRTAIEWAELSGSERVLDAYCGVGALGLFASAQAKEVLGVEVVDSAIENARYNAQLNQIENIQFQCSKVEDSLESIKNLDLVFINPPRKGCDEKVLHALIEAQIPSLIYVSCSPKSLSRDLDILRDHFEIDLIQPFDLFPHTKHVETLVKLSFKA